MKRRAGDIPLLPTGDGEVEYRPGVSGGMQTPEKKVETNEFIKTIKNLVKIIWDSLPEAGVADLEGVFLSDMRTLAASRSWAVSVDMWGEGGIGVVVTSEATDEGGLELLEDREVFGSFLSLKCREQNPLRWLSFIQSPFEHNRRHCFPLNFFRTPVF